MVTIGRGFHRCTRYDSSDLTETVVFGVCQLQGQNTAGGYEKEPKLALYCTLLPNLSVPTLVWPGWREFSYTALHPECPAPPLVMIEIAACHATLKNRESCRIRNPHLRYSVQMLGMKHPNLQ